VKLTLVTKVLAAVAGSLLIATAELLVISRC